MSRKQRLKARARQAPAGPVLHLWTIQRASLIGILLGLAAIFVVGVIGTSADAVRFGYAALLALTALCGASILWITIADMRRRGTSGRMRPIRGFDAGLALALLVPSLYALSRVWPELGL